MNTLSNKKMIDFLGVEEPEKYCKKKKCHSHLKVDKQKQIQFEYFT